MRTGLIAKKIGMSNYYSNSGENIPVTLLQVSECKIVDRHESSDPLTDKVLVGACKIKKVPKSMKVYFEKKNSEFFSILREFPVNKDDELKKGDSINANHFSEGQFIDVSGFSKGKGFSGVMKRHGFGGGPKTHGQREHPRSPGSIGQASDPSRVFKGIKMAGQYGNKYKTVRNLEIVSINIENNLLLLKGAAPGANNSIVRITK